jgi:thymidylate kinase
VTTFLQNPNFLSFFGEFIIEIFLKQDIDNRIFQLLYFSDRAAQIRQKENTASREDLFIFWGKTLSCVRSHSVGEYMERRERRETDVGTKKPEP